MIVGWRWRRNRAEESEARWVAAIINGAGKQKHPVNAARLLGRPFGVDVSPQEEAKAIRARRAREEKEREGKIVLTDR